MRVWVPMAFISKPPFFDLDYTPKKEKSQDRGAVLASLWDGGDKKNSHYIIYDIMGILSAYKSVLSRL